MSTLRIKITSGEPYNVDDLALVGANGLTLSPSQGTDAQDLVVTLTQGDADQYDRDNGQAGMYAVPPGVGGAAAALTASRAYAVRFVPSRSFTVAKIAFCVTTAAASDDACDVGIYDSALTKIVTKGATTGLLNSQGIKEVTITSTPLTRDTVYYAAFSCGTFGGSAASLWMTNFNAFATDFFGTGNGVREQTFEAAAHPLGASITTGGGVGTCPILALRES